MSDVITVNELLYVVAKRLVASLFSPTDPKLDGILYQAPNPSRVLSMNRVPESLRFESWSALRTEDSSRHEFSREFLCASNAPPLWTNKYRVAQLL